MQPARHRDVPLRRGCWMKGPPRHSLTTVQREKAPAPPDQLSPAWSLLLPPSTPPCRGALALEKEAPVHILRNPSICIDTESGCQSLPKVSVSRVAMNAPFTERPPWPPMKYHPAHALGASPPPSTLRRQPCNFTGTGQQRYGGN